jgi:hypothetical protein
LECVFQSLIDEQQSLEGSAYVTITGGDDVLYVLLIFVDKSVCIGA